MNSILKTITALAVVTTLNSCATKKLVLSDNVMYGIDMSTSAGYNSDWIKDTVSSCFSATIIDKGEYLLIKPQVKPNLATGREKDKYAPSPGKDIQKGDYYFPETRYDSTTTSLSYLDGKSAMQALSIPIRIRPKIVLDNTNEVFPDQVETGFSAGFSYGYKLSYNVYNISKDIFGQQYDRYSFTPGIFVGIGTTDLKKANTRNPEISYDRKAVVISYGCFGMLGYNSFNFGIAIGFDQATGWSSSQWVYKGRAWYGIMVALDIIK